MFEISKPVYFLMIAIMGQITHLCKKLCYSMCSCGDQCEQFYLLTIKSIIIIMIASNQ